jgi:hypothetical protein
MGSLEVAGADVWQPLRSNCFFWAARQWRRHGGFILIRRSYYAWWLPHFAWMPVGMDAIWSYTPIKYDAHLRWWKPLRYLWFFGHVGREVPKDITL